jgi:PRTRC genetic system ParB family protein
MGVENRLIEVVNLEMNPFNPRTKYEGRKFDELVASVRQHGVLQPIMVRPLNGDGKFQIIFGHRRYMAAKAADREHVPAMIRTDLSEDDVFDLMTIENLQREDLGELEEAKSFKAYIDRKGKGAVEYLAERTGIHPGYIRRRVAVLELPENILEKWGNGELVYGHLEQMIRVRDKKEFKDVANWLTDFSRYNRSVSVKDLKRHIDDLAPSLGQALFDITAAGCVKCGHNSDVQRQLFDVDNHKTVCHKPACFKQKTNNWLSIPENWKNSVFHKKYHTNGFLFYDGTFHNGRHHNLDYEDKKTVGEAYKKKCKSCENYVTVITLSGSVSVKDEDNHVYSKRACFKGDSGACFKSLVIAAAKEKQQKQSGASAGDPAGAPEPGETPAAPRVTWHGDYFRERFYEKALPDRIAALDPAFLQVRRLTLFSIIISNSTSYQLNLKGWFGDLVGYVREDEWSHMTDHELLEHIKTLDAGRVDELLREASIQVLMKGSTSQARHLAAQYFGIDLAAEWSPDEEFYAKKTKDELLQYGWKTGVFDEPAAKSFLEKEIGQKEYKHCKKSDLVRIFTESGVNLAGRVPAEVLNIKEPGGAE